MTITFDVVGSCTNLPTRQVEGYNAKDGLAHGSLDVTVSVCEDCHQTVRTQITSCGMTPYSLPPCLDMTGRCGDRGTYEPNKYSTVYEGIVKQGEQS